MAPECLRCSHYAGAAAGINVVIARAVLIGARLRVTPYWFNPSPLVTYSQLPVAANVFVGFRV